MTIVCALLAALGVFLAVEALGPRPVRVRLTDRDSRPFAQRLLVAFFGPAAERVLSIGRADLVRVKADLAVRLARAGYPPPFSTPEMVLSYRLLMAVLFAAGGGIFGLMNELGSASLPLLAASAVFGWSIPDQIVGRAERERREQLTLDAASTLDRLATHVAAGTVLPTAVRCVAERPGGAWVGELRGIASSYAVKGDFSAVLAEAAERSGRLPEIVRVCDRLQAAHEMGGGGVARSLRQMAGDARITIKNLITQRGYTNAVLMVLPLFFAIVAVGLILMMPGVVRISAVLG